VVSELREDDWLGSRNDVEPEPEPEPEAVADW
jgi:hypothetical protein